VFYPLRHPTPYAYGREPGLEGGTLEMDMSKIDLWKMEFSKKKVK
jgi:hypothetical protein